MSKFFKQFLALMLCALMFVNIMPMSVFAAYDYAHNEAESSDDYYDIISKKDWDIAPGIKESEIVLNNDAGDRRQVIHLMEADISNEYTRVISSYTNMDTSNYAISTIPEHAAFIENEWGENVVGAMNTCLSWYNSAAYAEDPSRVNEPLGFMMVDGEVYFDHSVGFPTCIVIHKDTNDAGEARPADIPKVEMRTVTDSKGLNGWEDQVIPCSSGYIVKDGVNQNKPSHGSDTAARSVVGVKADGSIVIMMNDGRQAPYSLGMNMYECAEVMIAAGCVYAANCDGGGSSTFMSQRPGEDLEVNCSPCDGALRQNTHGIMFISTAPSTGEFYNAYLQTENDYYVPYSEVKVEAIGRDFSGAEAALPAEAVWSLADDSFGTMSNGVFTSNGKTGEVVINLSYNGEVVGTKTINIVNPESVSFAQTSTVIPYGKSTSLDITAAYGAFEVSYTEDAFEWTVSDNEAGVREGLVYTATEDTAKNGVTITAKYKYADLDAAVLEIGFGKGSEVVWDFEDGDVSNWLGIADARKWLADNNIMECENLFKGGNFSDDNSSTTFLSSEEIGGKVHSGEYALGVELDFTHSSFSSWSYNMFFNVEGQTVLRDVANGKNATRLGMWVYIPEELWEGNDLSGIAAQTQLYGGSSADDANSFQAHLTLSTSTKRLNALKDEDIPEDRWVYCYVDLTGHDYVSLQNPEKQIWREPCFMRFYTQHYTPKNLIFYFDDITLDYSNAVDDREAPSITNLTINTSGTGVRSFNATIADHVAANTSGLDYSSAKILVDGVELPDVVASGSAMSSKDVALCGGTHTVTFIIKDNMGNTMKQSKTFTVEGDVPVTIGGHNATNSAPEYDSVYYVDINVADAAVVEQITTTLKLSTAHTWEADYMELAEGIEAEYTYNYYDNTVTVTLTKTAECTLEGAQTLASIPARIWSWNEEESGVTEEGIFAEGLGPIVSVDVKTILGSVSFVDGYCDGYIGTFNSSMLVSTNINDVVVLWHDHIAGEAQNKEATCTEDGYIGRVWCVGCNCVKYKEGGVCTHNTDGCGSVVDWGTVVKATGHDYKDYEGVLKCECGELFNGELDGVTYVDGVIADGWVNDTYYYENGVKFTGSHLINGKMCTFDENGVYLPNYIYDGWYIVGNTAMFFMSNEYLTGYQKVNSQPHFFDDNGMGYDGEYTIDGKVCVFDNGRFVSCEDETVLEAGWFGSTENVNGLHSVEYVVYEDASICITGSGNMMNVAEVGLIPWSAYVQKFIKTIFIAKDITNIGHHSFRNCFFATTVVFEDDSKVTEIGACAFYNMRSLKSIVLSENVKIIGSNAFGQTYNLTEVYLPDGVQTINSRAFVKSNADLVLNVAEGTIAHNFAVNNGFDVELREKKPVLVATGECGENLVWSYYANGKLVIEGSGAMYDFANRDEQPWAKYREQITCIEIGKEVTHLGTYAFAYSYNVKAINFAEDSKLQSIGSFAIFYMYRNLTELVLPESVATLAGQAIGYNSALVNVYIPQRIKSISAYTFLNSKNVVLNVAEGSYAETFAVKNSIAYDTREYVYSVIDSGFCGTNVTWTYYEDGRLVIGGSGAMDDFANRDTQPWAKYREQITNIVIGKDIVHLGKYAFAYSYNVRSVTFEEGSKLQSINSFAIFYMYRYLTDLQLPETVRTIAGQAFGYNNVLVDVYMPQSVTSIATNAFLNSKNVIMNVVEGTYAETFAINNNIAYITRAYTEQPIAEGNCGINATWAFYANGKLVISGSGAMDDFANRDAQPWAVFREQITDIVIGKDITHIGKYAFAYAYNVKSITFEEGSKLESIGALSIYYMHRYLTEIVLPESVKTISGQAFGYNSNLVNVYMPESLTSIAANTFVNSKKVVLNVVEGSYAETFAKDNDISYEVE